MVVEGLVKQQGRDVNAPSLTPKLVGRLANLLGCDDNTVIAGVFEAPRVVDMQTFHSLFVYSNNIEYSTVGDRRAPLLRIVNVEGRYGNTVTKTYVNPHYVPLKQKLVDTIEIDIRDDTGQPIPFITGKVIVKLQ